MTSTDTLPAGPLDATGRRIAHMYSAILGNGSLLATLSRRGELERIFWPHIDWGQHLGELRAGVTVDGATRWLDEDFFTHEQAYLEDCNALRTVARRGQLEVEITDLVVPDAPVLVRRLRSDAAGLRVAVYCRPELEETRRYGGVFVDHLRNALVFYRRHAAMAVVLAPGGEATCGQVPRHGEEGVFMDAADARLRRELVDHGFVDGALAGDLEGESLVLCAFGRSPDEALRQLDAPLEAGFEALFRQRRASDRTIVSGARPPVAEDTPLLQLYRRSLLVFDLVADRDSGGVIAAPEQDPDYNHCGGYGYVWGRDLAFIVLSFLAAGLREHAVRALRWLTRTQQPEGLWLQRHWTDGSLAPSWGLHQVDETGAILFAFESAWRELGDAALDAELWPCARRAADFLCGFTDNDTGLPRPSIDLWEERAGTHTYTAAAIYGGLRAAQSMAERHDPSLAPAYGVAAARVREGIERHLWSDTEGRYLRSMWRGFRDLSGSHAVPDVYHTPLPYPNPEIRSADREDPTVDISLLGLAWPFGAVDPGSPRMRATVAAIEAQIVLEDGGTMRYVGDTYAGGNPWILATLWLGLWYRSVGDEAGWRRCVDYALARATETGLLPEQATRDGRPAWVVPLTWSHAMLVLAVRPELGTHGDTIIS